MIESTETLQVNILDRYNKVLNVFNSTLIFQTSVIVEEILKEVKPISIYLIGSFGRNEGSLHLSERAIRPLRDYDILIVVNKYVKGDVIKEIRRNIHKRLGLPDPFLKRFKFKGFTVWITQVTLKDINAFPLLKFYELKEASTLLWGKDIRDSIHLSFEDVSAYNGILILFSKVEGLMGLLDIDALKRRRNLKETIDFVYECMKTYVEIGTCLSLLVKMYEPSFLGRCIKLSKNFKILFPELEKMNSTLPSLMVTYAYKRLLIEDEFLSNLDFGKLLVGTLKDLKMVIWYYIRKAYKVDVACSPTSSHVFDEYLSKLNTRALEDLFEHFIKPKQHFGSGFFKKLASRLYLRYTLLRFFVEGRKVGYRIRPRIVLRRNGNIMMKLWSVGFMLLDCVKVDFNICESTLYLASRRLCEVVDFDSTERNLPKEDFKLRFSYLKRIASDLLDLADRVFHRKD